MALGPQFEQPELPGMPGPSPAASPHVLSQRKTAVLGKDYAARNIERFAQSPMESRTPTESFHKRGDQLKMFMTPREIEHEWAPLDADREDAEVSTYGTKDPAGRQGEYTKRQYRTDDVPNNYHHRRTATGAETNSKGYKRNVNIYQRAASSNPVDYEGGAESPDQLWDRKYQEAADSPASGFNGQWSRIDGTRYKTPGGGSTSASGHWTAKTPGKTRRFYDGTSGFQNTNGNWTYNSRRRDETYVTHEVKEHSSPHSNMADSIAAEGVKSPIRLGLQTSQFEDSGGKPQMVGGHHRMAVARVEAPDRLAPVLYHTDIHEARSSNTQGSYKYT